jgi:hypothetical protein
MQIYNCRLDPKQTDIKLKSTRIVKTERVRKNIVIAAFSISRKKKFKMVKFLSRS